MTSDQFFSSVSVNAPCSSASCTRVGAVLLGALLDVFASEHGSDFLRQRLDDRLRRLGGSLDREPAVEFQSRRARLGGRRNVGKHRMPRLAGECERLQRAGLNVTDNGRRCCDEETDVSGNQIVPLRGQRRDRACAIFKLASIASCSGGGLNSPDFAALHPGYKRFGFQTALRVLASEKRPEAFVVSPRKMRGTRSAERRSLVDAVPNGVRRSFPAKEAAAFRRSATAFFGLGRASPSVLPPAGWASHAPGVPAVVPGGRSPQSRPSAGLQAPPAGTVPWPIQRHVSGRHPLATTA